MDNNTYILPTAQELREYQSKRRFYIIKAIKNNANLGYVGLSLESELFPKQMLKELEEAGYTVTTAGKFTNIKWGEE